MTLRKLTKIIKRLENEGFQVYGCAFDMGNHTLIKNLQMKSNGTYFFENPVDSSRNVYLFPDVPHIIKRARNHLIGNI